VEVGFIDLGKPNHHMNTSNFILSDNSIIHRQKEKEKLLQGERKRAIDRIPQ
jgi:hypothetical protein